MPVKKESLSEIERMRHSLAHLLAYVALEKFPKAKLGIGPVIENGFYYDILFPSPVSENDLKEFEKRIRHLIASGLPFTQTNWTKQKATRFFKDQPFKKELIKELPGKTVGISQVGEFTDLCRGGHVKNSSEIKAFKITHQAGAYWRGDEKNKMLTRIYGLAFSTDEELKKHEQMLLEAQRRDHKKLGTQLDLFSFSELVGSGLPLWTPRGTLLRNLLDDYVWELRRKYGYEKVEIPHITKKDLYEVSGHWDKFKDELFRIKTREGHEFAMKPMNCPHHTQIYARKAWSYRELPQRYANTTMCYRDEQTGELSGLARARSFTQDDAHVFCRPSQTKDEFLKIWDIVHEFYGVFGFNLSVRLSLHDPKHPEKYLGDKKRWKSAEDILRQIVTEKKVEWFEGLGEAAFYGPKLDFMATDALGRQWQVATIQLDMNMPERFDLKCTDEQGKPERIVMIHAAIMGSIERFLSILIEHFTGAFPLWLSPVQVSVLPITYQQHDYAKSIMEKITAAGIRAELDDRNEGIGRKIRDAEKMKTPIMLVIGKKEAETGIVAVREHGKGDQGTRKIDELLSQLKEKTEKKK